MNLSMEVQKIVLINNLTKRSEIPVPKIPKGMLACTTKRCEITIVLSPKDMKSRIDEAL